MSSCVLVELERRVELLLRREVLLLLAAQSSPERWPMAMNAVGDAEQLPAAPARLPAR